MNKEYWQRQYEIYKKMNINKLQRILDDSLAFAEKYPEFLNGWHNEFCGFLKMIIAEKIGRNTRTNS